jgi:hypothetical protein
MRQENSVLFALRDLRSMEADRVADERARAEEERVRAEDERARREEAERVERALVEAETRNRELAATLGQMQATITALAERAEQSNAPAMLPVAAVSLPEPPRPTARWPMVLTVAALAIALVAWLRPRERTVYVPISAPTVAAAPAAAPPIATPPTTTPPTTTPSIGRTAVEEPAARPRPKRPAPRPQATPRRPLPTVTTCNGDPLCGVPTMP